MLTSLQNSRVKEWNKLKKKKDRNKTQSFLVEGFHLVEEAIQSDWTIKEVILREEVEVPSWVAHERVTRVSSAVFSNLSETETPQGIAAVIEMKRFEVSAFQHVLLVDAVQDPGNLGTLIRTADAAGFDAVIVGNGSVDAYNEKVIRATQGSLFHLPIHQGDLIEWIPSLKKSGITIMASTLKDAKPFHEVSPPEKAALIVGNEGAGIQPEVVSLADQQVYIPIYGQAESLNVAIAAGILMYHLKI